jgi:alpha-N-arabinofuranosidase
MRAVGIADPHLAITELQLFARPLPPGDDEPARLRLETMPSSRSMAEAVYDALFYHLAVRLAPFVEMVTHSASVNHGGGIKKERERVYANPCHYAQTMLAAFAGATAVSVDLETSTERAPGVLPRAADLQIVGAEYGVVDAIAAIATDGALLVSLAHRGTAWPVRVAILIDDFEPAATASVELLSAEHPWDGNSLANPEWIVPRDLAVPVADERLTLDLPPFTIAVVRVPAA